MLEALQPLPAIPAKRYFTIGEVSELCGVKPYVLRYWEQEFTQLRPMKRRGNRRYYQHHEVLLIRRIRDLLYDQGFTISGARNRLHDAVHELAHESVGADLPEGETGDQAPVVPALPDSLDPVIELPVATVQRASNSSYMPPLATAALGSGSASAAMRVRPPLPDNPSAEQVREELLAIRELLSF